MKCSREWSTFLLPIFTAGIGLISGCAGQPTISADVPNSRISFRLEAPGTQRILEVQSSDCFLPSDPTIQPIMDMSYDPNVTTLIRFSGPRRVGMPVTGEYPEQSYAETRVAAGQPLALRFRVFVNNNIYAQSYQEVVFTPRANTDYEILTTYPDGPRGEKAAIHITQITQQDQHVKLVPVTDATIIPACSG